MSVTHKKIATLADQPGVEINKAEWNDTHTVSVDLASEVTGVLPTANGGYTAPTSTDNAAARYDGISGLLQNSGLIIDDSVNVSGALSYKAGTLSYSDTGILESLQSSTNSYNQSIIQNTNAGASASASFIINNNSSTATTNYGEFGINSSAFSGSGSLNIAGATYLTATTGELVLGTTTANGIRFLTNSSTTDALAIDSSGNITAIGTVTITSANASAFAIGRQGATNPALLIDASTASSATGWSVTSAAAGGGVTLSVISSGTNEAAVLQSKGTGNFTLNAGNGGQGSVILQTNSNTRLTLTNLAMTHSPGSNNTAATPRFTTSNAADSALTAGAEAIYFLINMSSNVRTHASNTAITLQRDGVIAGTTHAFASSGGVITDSAALTLVPGDAGTNATITNLHGLLIQTKAIAGTVTNSYGLNITAATGATNNYAFSFGGAAGTLLTLRTDGQIILLATNTAAGTTGAQTINKPSGTVNFAATNTSLVVTNSLASTSSIILATLLTNDATARIANVVRASGSFTINLTAAATAETACGFLVIN